MRRTPQVFADILNEQTVLGKMRAFGLTVDAPPFAFIPTVSDTPSTAWVAEGAKIPLARAGFSTARTGATKHCTMFAGTNELFRSTDPRAQNIPIRLSTRQAARGLDLTFLGDAAATDEQPAGLLRDVIGTVQGSPSGFESALEVLYATVTDGRAARPVFVASGRGALYLLATNSRAARLDTQIARLDDELANLAETAARGGAVPAILEALARREEERRRLVADVTALKRSSGARHARRPVDLRAQLRRYLDDWQTLLADDPARAHGLLDLALTDRIRFMPNPTQRRYELTVPIAFDRLITAIVPEFQGDLQEMMASHSIPSWNQIDRFLRDMAQLRQSAGFVA